MNRLIKIFENQGYKNICILGFAREGKSTLAFLKQHYPCRITISDKNPEVFKDFEDQTIAIKSGDDYLNNLESFDLIIKSPGIALPLEIESRIKDKLTSQTKLFLQAFHNQIIGITGTKGKSTTSSLIFHVLKENHYPAVIVGNIGIPPFDQLSGIDEKSRIVYELSAQQLYDVEYSPHIALFLNLFSDHIDYFGNMERYGMAKFNILKFQKPSDFFIYRSDCEFIKNISEHYPLQAESIEINEKGSAHFERNHHLIYKKGDQKTVFDFEKTHLKGAHNLINTLFAVEALTCCGLSFEQIISPIYSFQPLANRLEWVGTFNGKRFYNDSIATVPEAAMAALSAIDNIQTIILGGYDRGVDLTNLVTAVAASNVQNIIFTGPSGKRMMERLIELFPNHGKNILYFTNYDGLVEKAVEITSSGGACVLSPASPSFDSFKDFTARGHYFKKTVKAIFGVI